MIEPWTGIAERLEPALAALQPPASYLVGRRCGRAGGPDNILLFQRHGFAPGSDIPHHHHRHVLILALAGSGSVCIDRHVHRLRPGRAVLIHPHQLHHYADVHPPLRWLFVTCEYDGPPLTRLYNRAAAMRPDQEGLLARLLELFADPRPEAAERLALLVQLLLGELSDHALPPPRDAPAVPGPARSDLLGRVNRILYDRLADPPGIAQLARELGLSASHLRALIRRSLGLGLGQYMLRVRLNQARMLLADPRLSIGEVARRCGFASLSAFSRAWRRATGASPRIARRPGTGADPPVTLIQ